MKINGFNSSDIESHEEIVITGHNSGDIECKSITIGAHNSGDLDCEGRVTIKAHNSGEIRTDGDVIIGGHNSNDIRAEGNVTIKSHNSSGIGSCKDVTIGAHNSSNVFCDGNATINGHNTGIIIAAIIYYRGMKLTHDSITTMKIQESVAREDMILCRENKGTWIIEMSNGNTNEIRINRLNQLKMQCIKSGRTSISIHGSGQVIIAGGNSVIIYK